MSVFRTLKSEIARSLEVAVYVTASTGSFYEKACLETTFYRCLMKPPIGSTSRDAFRKVPMKISV